MTDDAVGRIARVTCYVCVDEATGKEYMIGAIHDGMAFPLTAHNLNPPHVRDMIEQLARSQARRSGHALKRIVFDRVESTELAPAVKPPWLVDAVEKSPDLTGPAGRAWDVQDSLRAAGQLLIDRVVEMWIVEVPGAHPLWHSYAIAVIHLRPMDNDPDLLVCNKDATHEIAVAALDPASPRAPIIAGGPLRLLVPTNYVGQFQSASDEAARATGRNVIRALCDGRLNPDTDAASQWIALFGDHCLANRPSVPAWGSPAGDPETRH